MIAVVRIFGIVIVVIGMVFLLSPKTMRQYINFWIKGKRLYGGAALSFLFGIVLLLAASQCRLSWFIAILGIMGLIKGAVLLVLGPEKLIAMLDWWLKRPDLFLRLYSLLPLAIGALVICS